MGRAYTMLGGDEDSYKIFNGKHEGKRAVGRHRHRWEDNINMDFRELYGRVWTGFIWLNEDQW
jgi:hypothetical protein